MSAKSNFKKAVIKAKKLYKTGRYNKFSDAVKAAYKSPGIKTKRTTKRKTVSNVRRSAKKKTVSGKALLKQQLGNAMVARYECQTIAGTKKLGNRIKEIKRKLRSK